MKSELYHVKGRIVDASSGTPVKGPLLLRLGASDGSFAASSATQYSTTAGESGEFEFSGVVPGSYLLGPELMNVAIRVPGRIERLSPKLFGAFPVTVSHANLDRVVVEFRAGGTITGTVSSSEQEAAPSHVDSSHATQALPTTNARPASRPSVHLRSEQEDNNYSVTVKEDGSFELADIAPDRYQVSVTGLPEGSYVKALRLDDEALPDGVVDLTVRNQGTLQIDFAAWRFADRERPG